MVFVRVPLPERDAALAQFLGLVAAPRPVGGGGLTSGPLLALWRAGWAVLAVSIFKVQLVLAEGARLRPPAVLAEPTPAFGLLGTQAALLGGAGLEPRAQSDRTPPLNPRRSHMVFLWFPPPEMHALIAKKDALLK